MYKRFVLLSGLPGSGKSTLARQLAPALKLPLIDKDAILERLFESKGVGDARWRRTLSRESDRILQAEASASEGAVLVSFWHLPGMPADSGTSTRWLRELSAHVVNIHCVCEPELAAERFLQRKRHDGHLDGTTSYADVLASLQRLAGLALLDIGQRIEVDTSQKPRLKALVRDIQSAFRV
jgi:chloramphenicol 3-O-phosphotransferase